MPSLTELVQRVHDQLDFDPDLQQYKDSVVRRINHHYLEVCDNDHWLFLQKKTDVSLKKKVEGSATKTITIDSATPRRGGIGICRLVHPVHQVRASQRLHRSAWVHGSR